MNFRIYKVKDWKRSEKEMVQLPNGRYYICIEIGKDAKGEPLEEWIYQDIIEDIDASPKDYNVITRVGHVPQLTVRKKGKLVIHNEQAREYNVLIQQTLPQIPMGLLTKAITEIRLNAERYSTRNHSTNAVISTINALANVDFSADFVYAVLIEYYEIQYNTPVTELQDSVHFADYEELVAYACDAVLHMNENCEDEVIKHFKGDEVIAALGKELVFRLLTSEIHQR